jgi:hypothetical protein
MVEVAEHRERPRRRRQTEGRAHASPFCKTEVRDDGQERRSRYGSGSDHTIAVNLSFGRQWMASWRKKTVCNFLGFENTHPLIAQVLFRVVLDSQWMDLVVEEISVSKFKIAHAKQ